MKLFEDEDANRVVVIATDLSDTKFMHLQQKPGLHVSGTRFVKLDTVHRIASWSVLLSRTT